MDNHQSQDLRPDITAATRGGDVTLGMDTEPDPLTANREQALYWQTIYTEILAMEESVIAHMYLLMQDLSPQSRDEVARTNLPVVLIQAEKFRSRLSYWNTCVTQMIDDA